MTNYQNKNVYRVTAVNRCWFESIVSINANNNILNSSVASWTFLVQFKKFSLYVASVSHYNIYHATPFLIKRRTSSYLIEFVDTAKYYLFKSSFISSFPSCFSLSVSLSRSLTSLVTRIYAPRSFDFDFTAQW